MAARPPLLLLLLQLAAAAAGLSRNALLRGGAACALGAAVCTEAYARAPTWSVSDLPAALAADDSSLERLVLVLPGAGGPDANSARIVASLRAILGGAGSRTRVVEYDWSAFVGDQLQAPYNAQRLGRSLGSEVVASCRQLRSLHVVGISVGAFAADALTEAYRGAGGSAHLRLSLLDPFTAFSVPGLALPSISHGVRRFGASADYAEAFVNTDDPVPATNTYLQLAANYDVTAAAERGSFVPLPGDSLHSWPAAWFGLNTRRVVGSGLGEAPLHAPAGAGPARGSVQGVE